MSDEFILPRYLSKSGMDGTSSFARFAFLNQVKSSLDIEVM